MWQRAIMVAVFVVGMVIAATPDCAVVHCVYLPSAGNGIELTPLAASPIPSATSTPTMTATRTPTRTPTSTPTMTPVPVTLLPNGDFESGTTGWPSGGLVITTSSSPAPHSGTHLVRLDAVQQGISAELDSVDVVVPANTPYLSYWIWIQSTEQTCGQDRGGVGINSTAINKYDLCTATQSDHWEHHTLNLSAYIGQTETVILIADTFDNDVSNSLFYVDDVGWQATP